MPGVTVIIKGTTTGTITNTDGKFNFSVPSDSKILVFSFVGMKTQEFTIAGKTVFNVVMEDEAVLSDEVVIVGYGSQKKGSVVGAIDKIKPSELKLPTRTVSTSLAGRLAGIINISRTMRPRPYLIKPWSIVLNGDPVLLNAEGEYNYVDQEPSSASYSNYLSASLSSQNTNRNM